MLVLYFCLSLRYFSKLLELYVSSDKWSVRFRFPQQTLSVGYSTMIGFQWLVVMSQNDFVQKHTPEIKDELYPLQMNVKTHFVYMDSFKCCTAWSNQKLYIYVYICTKNVDSVSSTWVLYRQKSKIMKLNPKNRQKNS